jgi:hypothetical protein
MKPLRVTAISLVLLGAAPVQQMEISPSGSRHAPPAPAEYFTGSVIVEPLFGAKDSMPATGGLVTFAPGARGMAYAPRGSNPDRHRRHRLGAGRRRRETRDQARRCDLDAAGSQTLARRHGDHLHEPYRHHEYGGWSERRLAGESE